MQLDEPIGQDTDAGSPWNMVKRAWRWVTSPFAARPLRLVDLGPVGTQLRDLDGRAQVHGTAIEIISAQVNDILRDQNKILLLLERQKEAFEHIDGSVGRLTSARAELADGLTQVQRTLSEDVAGMRMRLASLPSTDQMRALVDGGMAQELASAKGQLSGQIQEVQRALLEQTSSVHERLATMPSTEHVHTLIGGGMVVDELASTRQELVDEMKRVRQAFAEETAALHERLTALPSAEQVHVLVGGTVVEELASARAHLVDEIQSLRRALAEETAGVREVLATQPSTEQVHALIGGGTLAQEFASTRAQLADGLQKVQHVLAEQTAGVRDRLATLPSTEQIHAFVEGGTANSIQSARRLISEEAQRGQATAERMARKLEFLQSRSVIPLPAQGLVMCRNPLGFLAVPADDLATIGSLADGVLPDQGTLKVVQRYLKAGGTFVDVGANVGLFSLLAARIVGPGGKVIAIEPAPAAAQALRATVDANGLANIVSVKEIAAGSEQSLGTLSVETNSGQSTLLGSATAGTTVVASVVPLDDILGTTIPDVVKIDVEGFEPHVIEGMKATLRANPELIVIMEFEPSHIRSTGLSAAAWVDRLVAAGLQIFEIDERSGELLPLRRHGIEEIVSVNVVIARDDPSRRAAEALSDGWLRLGSGAPALLT